MFFLLPVAVAHMGCDGQKNLNYLVWRVEGEAARNCLDLSRLELADTIYLAREGINADVDGFCEGDVVEASFHHPRL